MKTSDIAIPFWLAILVVGTVCGLALWRGGWAERVTAATLVLAWFVTRAVKDYSYAGPQWGPFYVTIVVLFILIFIAFRSHKFWPLFAAGFQLLNVVTHLARIMDRTVGAWAYASAGVLWSYLILFALAFGVVGEVRRRPGAGA